MVLDSIFNQINQVSIRSGTRHTFQISNSHGPASGHWYYLEFPPFPLPSDFSDRGAFILQFSLKYFHINIGIYLCTCDLISIDFIFRTVSVHSKIEQKVQDSHILPVSHAWPPLLWTSELLSKCKFCVLLKIHQLENHSFDGVITHMNSISTKDY